MKIAKFLSILGILAMMILLFNSFAYSNFGVESARLLAMPWRIASLVHLSTGFTLFSMWIIYRKKSLPVAIPWKSSR